MALSQTQRDRILLGIGSVVVASVQVEWSTGRTYVLLSHLDDKPTDPLGANWSVLYERCRKVIDPLPAGPVTVQVRALLARADDLYQLRNKAVHGLWLMNITAEPQPPFDERQLAAGPATYAVNFRRTGNSTKRWDAQQLEALAVGLHAVARDLDELVIPLGGEVGHPITGHLSP